MPSRRALPRGATISLLVVACMITAGCSSDLSPVADPPTPPTVIEERFDTIDAAISDWRTAANRDELTAAGEHARNLIVGAHGPLYGDANSDGVVSGTNDIGILPGNAGEEALATAALGACVVSDVLGGSWANPAERWSILETAIAEWRPHNNTFPALPSHPQRIVGWATLALNESDLETAREYASHAQLHSDISQDALRGCDT